MSLSFGSKVLPTKITLIKLKKSLALAKKVKKILEDKREVILHKLNELIDEITEEKKKIYQPLFEAYNSLNEAFLSEGAVNIFSIAKTTPPNLSVNIKEENLMGVKIANLSLNIEKFNIPYGFIGTSNTLDKFVKKLQQLLPILIKNAEKENAIFKLAEELKKTQRQVNALKYVIIPNYEKTISYITNVLEEREREEFVRLKKIKGVLERKIKYGR